MEGATERQDGKHIEGELKTMMQTYQDVHTNLVSMKRKRGWVLELCVRVERTF